MLTYYRKPFCLSLISTDQPVWSVVETVVTVYQKDRSRFLLLLTAPSINESVVVSQNLEKIPCQEQDNAHLPSTARQWWLEIAPNQVIMTQQGNAQLSYRHFWQQGAYGRTRYWLPNESSQQNEPIRLHNFTRSLILKADPIPEQLRVEYELLAGNVQLGNYILNLEIKQ